MSSVSFDIHGKTYVLGCEDGGEAHLRDLAARVDARVRLIAPDAGAAGETRLMLMAALTLADDLAAATARLEAAQVRLRAVQADFDRLEDQAVAALEAAALRMETLAPE